MSSARRIRFEKVASARVQKIIDYLDLLGNCANKNNYEYTDKDVQKMFATIKERLKNAEAAYDTAITRTEKNKFKF